MEETNQETQQISKLRFTKDTHFSGSFLGSSFLTGGFLNGRFFKNLSQCSILSLACISTSLYAANPWHDASFRASTSAPSIDLSIKATHERLASTSVAELSRLLNPAKTKNAAAAELDIPLPNGDFATFSFTKTQVLPDSLSQQYADIATFKALSTDYADDVGHFTLTPQGLHGLFSYQGRLVVLDAKSADKSTTVSASQPISHTSYYADHELNDRNILPDTFIRQNHSDIKQNHSDHSHHHDAESSVSGAISPYPLARPVVGNTLTTYRVGFSTTGEYAQAVGGTKSKVLAELTRIVNSVNFIYERDLGISLVLADNADKLIFTNASSDPFKNNDPLSDIETNQRVVAQNVGLKNIDLAHVLTTQGSGLAYNGVCDDDYKAQATSGFQRPASDYFYISLVAHEIGHQLGANHTFNGNKGACKGYRNGQTAWEPGSGSSIMSYAGICESDNLNTQQNFTFGRTRISGSDEFFHIGSILEIQNYTQTQSCGVKSTKTNTIPTADAGVDHTIPVATAFKLKGSGFDADNDSLTYMWEQKQIIGSASAYLEDRTDPRVRPLFRSYTPSKSKERYFPVLSGVISGNLPLGESFATVKRKINLNFTVRDGKGGVATDSTTITTDSACPFSVLEPTSSSAWAAGGSAKVLWDTAGSQNAPINCTKVDISFDTGSQKFSTVLASNVPNDGEHIVAVPKITSSAARVMVSCSDGIFYAVNSGPFKVVSAVNAKPMPQTPADLSDVCENPITTSNSATDVPVKEVVQGGTSGDIIDNPPSPNEQPSTDSNSGSSGGSGGGALPAWLIMLLCATSLLSACNTHGTDPKLKKKTAKHMMPTSPHAQTHMQDALTLFSFDQSKVKEDVLTAIAHDDFKLWAAASRGSNIYAVDADNQFHYRDTCGIRYLPNSGDTLKQGDDVTERQQLKAYAEAYNKMMVKPCEQSVSETN